MDLSFATFRPLIGALEQAGLPIIEAGLTTAATAVAGPFGLLVSPAINVMLPMINNALGISVNATPDETAAAVATATPDQMTKLQALQETDAFKLASGKAAMDNALATTAAQQTFDTAQNAGQNALNTVEVSNPSLFVAGPRPAIMWGLGALLMVYKTLPLLVYGLNGFGLHLPPPPDMDFTTLAFVGSLLGITVAARSYDKSQGNDTKAMGGTSVVAVKPTVVKISK